MQRQMTRRAIVLAALCTGALAALLVLQFLRTERTRAAARVAEAQPLTSVVVPLEDIPARTVLEPDMLRVEDRPSLTLPSNCANIPLELVAKVSLVALPQEQPIRRDQVAVKSAALGLSYVVPMDLRAVTVALDPIMGVAGFLKPGDRVDVLATFTLKERTAEERSITKTVLQDVELLALGAEVRETQVSPEEKEAATDSEKATRPAEPPREQPNATLAVTPEDAQKLILAENKGRLRLTLRRVDDRAKVLIAPISAAALIGSSAGSHGSAPARSRSRSTSRPAVLPLGYTSPAFSPGFSASGMALPPVLWGTSGHRASASETQDGKIVEVVRGSERSRARVPRGFGAAATSDSVRVTP